MGLIHRLTNLFPPNASEQESSTTAAETQRTHMRTDSDVLIYDPSELVVSVNSLETSAGICKGE